MIGVNDPTEEPASVGEDMLERPVRAARRDSSPDTARIGVDLGGTKIEAVLLDDEGRVRKRKRVPTPPNYRDALDVVTTLVRSFDLAAGVRCKVGIGTPGAWVAERGEMKNCNCAWLNGQPLVDDLELAMPGRIRIANDADCFALSEALDGAGVGARVVFGVILGTGVGGGIVVRGKVLAGPNGVAGEWGHTPLPYLGESPLESALGTRPCYCGRANCVETYLSGGGLVETHRLLAGERLDAAAIPPDAPSVTLYKTMLARALAQVVNLLDPDVIVLGGGLSKIRHLANDVQNGLAAHGFTHEGRTKVLPAVHGDASGVLGAARLWQ